MRVIISKFEELKESNSRLTYGVLEKETIIECKVD